MTRRNNNDDIDISAAINTFRRLDRRSQIVVATLLLIAGIVLAVAYYRSQHAYGPSPVPAGYPHLLLGNPSNASEDPSNRDNYLMAKPWFAVAYNDSRGTPNWVSWRVSAEDLGSAPRKQMFDPDATLPASFRRITQQDYTGSGFDRGHMCPHSDRAASQEMSFSTFVMTNIIPQAPNVNRKAWEQLESYGRDLVAQEHERLYIVAGPLGQGGRGSKGFAQSLGGGRVTVPSACWKIIVVVPEAGGADDLAKLSVSTRVIAVIMPNDNEKVDEPWAPFRTSVAEVERQTGLHFFDRVRPDIADAMRRQIDAQIIPPPRPRHFAD